MLCDPRDLRIHIGQLASGFSARNTGAVSTAWDAYDAWGKSMAHTGTTTQPYQFVGQLGYYTHWQDENLALLQLGVRFYDPEIGRFTQRDAARLDRECAYAYTGNSPVYWVDPRGLRRNNRRNNVAGDKTLQKCLSKLRECTKSMREDIGKAIDRVGDNWYTDDNLNNDTAATVDWDLVPEWNYLGIGCPCTFDMIPNVLFNPKKHEPWSLRNLKGQFDNFCTTVLHELMHVAHGFWRMTYCDAPKETWGNPDYYQEQAESYYDKHCKDKKDK